jgi:hypothetical protein
MGRTPLGRIAIVLAPLALAACEDTGIVAISPVLSVSPLSIDFGTVELSQDERRTLSLRNLERVGATVESLLIDDDCGGCFLAINPPVEIEPYVDYPLELRFRAVRLDVATATVTIKTDDPKSPVTYVQLVGRGKDTRRPDIAVAPESVDFGFVPAGGIAVKSFVVRSTGTNDLIIDDMVLDPPDAPYSITTTRPTPANPGRLAPGAQASVSLRATLSATVTGTVAARILIRTNVLEEKNVPGEVGVLAVPLTARANLPPLAIVGGDQTVEPWSRATLDGSASRDQDDPPDEPLTYRWTLTSKPSGSTTYIERATSPIASFWVDLTGRYEAQLVVTDALGLESEAKTVVIDALPTNAIRIELTWDHPDSDLDLHLIRGGGTFCDCATDCHYRDCGREPSWFAATPGANPRLDIDDRSGFGPENINIDGDGAERLVADGEYTILVHYYSSNDGVSSWPTNVSTATVRVYVFGLLAAELVRPLENDGDLWTAGLLRWPAQSITPLDSVAPAALCGVF